MSRTRTVSVTQTGGYTRLVVPTGYSPIVNVDLAGAGGGGGANYYGASGRGGNGGRITGSLSLKPGDILDVYVGEGGRQGGYGLINATGGAGGRSARIGTVSGETVVYPVTLDYAWSSFMNDYAVWVNPDGVSPINVESTIIRYVNITTAGTYTFQAECDNYLQLYIDDVNIINTSDYSSYYATSATRYLTAGQHTIRMKVSNWGGPAGVAVALFNPTGTQIWNTRSVLNPNTFSYWFRGGQGGNTYGDGRYVYSAPGGGGGASVVFLNGRLILVAGGGGGGGAEGGHGAGATAGRDAGESGGGSPLANQGQPGSDGNDIAGTPGGGGGLMGGSQGGFIYYDDAPSTGANGGTNFNDFEIVYNSGISTYTVPAGKTSIRISATGGGGGGGGNDSHSGYPGYGGNKVEADISVKPGDVLTLVVGNGGSAGASGARGWGGGVGGTDPNGKFNGGRGGNAGGSGSSGAGGGGGAATSVYRNGVLVLVAGGGAGGGGGGNRGAAYGKASQGYVSSGSTNGGAGQDKGGDGGGAGGGGGGNLGGAGGSTYGGDEGAYSGSSGANLVPAGGVISTGSNGGANGGGNGGTGKIVLQPGIWSYSTYNGSGGTANGSDGFFSVTFTEMGSGKVKVAGNWKQITNQYVKVGTQWKQITNVWTKVDGVWKIVSGGSTIPTTFTEANYG